MPIKHRIDVATADDGSTVGSNGWNDTHSITTELSPDTNDAASLGTLTGPKLWSDIFLASGAVINWNSGAKTLTESTNQLTLVARDFLLHTTSGGAGGIFMGLAADNFTRAKLGLDNSNNPFLAFGDGTNARDTFLNRASSGVLNIGTDATNASGSLKAGKILINGVSETIWDNTTIPTLQVAGTGSVDAHAAVIRYGASNGPPRFFFAKSRGSFGTNTSVSADDQLGEINWQGTTGSYFQEAAAIKAEVDGTPGSNDLPGRLVFKTTSDGAFVAAERVRINNSGRVLIQDPAGAVDAITIDGFVARLQIINTQSSNWGWANIQNRNSVGGAQFAMAHSRSATPGAHTTVQLGDDVGTIWGYGSDGTQWRPTGWINWEVDDTGTVSTSSMPGRIAFGTTPDGSTIVSQRMHLDSAGRLVVGHTAAVTSYFGQHALVQFHVNPDTNTALGLYGYVSTAASGPLLALNRSRNNTFGAHTVVQSGDRLGEIRFRGSDGDDFIDGARIVSEVDGTPSDNDMPGRLSFWTTPDGTYFSSERVRIDSTGNVLIGHFTNLGLGAANQRLQVVHSGSGGGINNVAYDSGGNGGWLFFGQSNTNTVGDNALTTNGTRIALIGFRGNDGTGFFNCAQIQVHVDGTSGTGDLPGRMTFWTTPDGSITAAERMRIDNHGRITVNTPGSAAETVDGSDVRMEIAADTGSDFGLRINEWGNNAFGSEIIFTRSRGAERTHTVLTSGDSLGGFMWYGSDGSAFRRCARIRVEVDGTPGSSDMPGRILFFTTPDGSATLSERLRIDSAGNVLIQTSSAYLKQTAIAVSSLPSASTAGAGAKMFVSDANATTFASVVAGGGSNNIPVYSDGTDWRIG